jgi:hypothetical protein
MAGRKTPPSRIPPPRIPPPHINVAARSLSEAKFRKRIVKSKKTYTRKRRDAERLAPFHLPLSRFEVLPPLILRPA